MSDERKDEFIALKSKRRQGDFHQKNKRTKIKNKNKTKNKEQICISFRIKTNCY